MKVEEEFDSIDQAGSWAAIYHKIRQDTLLQHEFSVKDSKRPEFKGRNRYRDVSPYDHSRVKLLKNDLDYINASLIEHPAADRSYILTQGPLPNTASHFWLMVWENDSKAILMLNRIIEKGQVKCHQYFPMGSINEDEDDMLFEDVGLKVSYIGEENANFFVVRVLEITEIETDLRKRVLQFHYITWPDFGVPESPKEFLNFLFAVREAGVLEPSVGPAVIHCSAGIGRSGTFCLVDTCLVLLEKQQEQDGVKVCDILMDMRRYRMGLIQTADQLRFSYLAIIEGCKLMSSPTIDYGNNESLSNDDHRLESAVQNGEENGEDTSDVSPSSSDSPRYTNWNASGNPEETGKAVRHSGIVEDYLSSHTDKFDENNPRTTPNDASHSNSTSLKNGLPDSTLDYTETNSEGLTNRSFSHEIRRRNREERNKKTAEQVALMKRKQKDCEKWKIRQQRAKPYLWGVSLAVLLGSYLIYHYYF